IAANTAVEGGTVTLIQSDGFADIFGMRFLANEAFQGGAIEIFSTGELILDDSLFVGNYVTGMGGAINALEPGDNVSIDMELNTVAYNQAESGAGGYAGRTGCDNTPKIKRFGGNIFYFNDDVNPGFDNINDNVFVEESFGPVCGPDARATFEGLLLSAGDTLIDFESVATGTNLTTQIPGVTFASISDVNGNPAGPFHVEVSAAFAGSDGNTIVGAPCGGCTDDGRVRYEMVFDTPQRRVGLQRIWNNFTVTRFFDIQGQLLHEFAGGDDVSGDYQFVGYVAETTDTNTWVARVEIDGESSGGSRQVGYTDDLFFGSTDVVAEFGLGENHIEEFNNVQGGPISPEGLASDPLFVSGFYLDQGASPAVDAFIGIDADQEFSEDPATTDPTGAQDTGTLDIGFHYSQAAQAPADAVGPDALITDYTEGLVEVNFTLMNGSQDLLETAQLIGVCIGAGSTIANPEIFSLTTLDPVSSCNSVLAYDRGNGTYAVAVSAAPFASGTIILDMFVNGSTTPISMTVEIEGANP
ncbi:MAG: hypothetical protein HKM98_02710, partial [Gammaproteobacteria bacterium]|nr:hypothetical protein [Gammaproteobacteria bacterium]